VHSPSTTYRITQIPLEWDRDTLCEWLTANTGGPKLPGNVHVYSLTSTSVTSSQALHQTATVQFQKTPYMFRKSKEDWSLRQTGVLDNIIIDVHFRGFTALNDVKADEHILE